MRTMAQRTWERSTPLFWLTGGLLAGQLAALATAGPAARWLGGAVAVLHAARIGRHRWLLTRRAPPVGGGNQRGRWDLPIGLAALAAVVGHAQLDGVLRPVFASDHIQRWAGSTAELRGRIVEPPIHQPERTRLLLDLSAARRGGEWQSASGRVQVTLRQDTQAWQAGDDVEAVLALRRPRNFGNPGELDYEAYLARRGIYVTAFAASDAAWRRRAAAGDALQRWRAAVARTIAATLPPPEGPIAAALLIGDLGSLDASVRTRFARAGVSHVLSISGLHIALVASAGYAIGRWLLARSRVLLLYANVPKLALTVSLGPVLLYAAIAGANVATVRSELMGGLLVAAVLLNRPRDWLAPVATSAAAISLWWPGAVCEISFQLSFVAVLALALGMPRVTVWWNRWEAAHLVRLREGHWPWLRWLVLSQGATCCAVLGTAPLTAWHFNQVSLIAVLANPIVVPLLGLVTVGVGLVATLAVALAPPLAAPLFHVVGVAVHVADILVAVCAAVPGASVRVVTPSLLELGCLYGLLAVPLLARPAARRAVAAASLALLAADSGYWLWQRWVSEALRVTFLSVGQGDCAVLELPRGRVMVIDGGGLSASLDVGERVVAPFLWQRKIARVDVLVLSHADFDHFGGLTFLARAFAPTALWWNGAGSAGVRFAELEAALREAGVVQEVLARGTRRRLAGVEVAVLHPPADGGGSDNDRSLTLHLRYGSTTLLFPGDLEATGEAALVAADGDALRSTVLKVPHHGSRSSSSARFLAAVQPRLAILSLGFGNRFGFPHPLVLDAYRRAGVALWRTDRDGAIELRIDRGGALAVHATRSEPIGVPTSIHGGGE